MGEHYLRNQPQAFVRLAHDQGRVASTTIPACHRHLGRRSVSRGRLYWPRYCLLIGFVPRYRGMRGTIVGEAVVPLATPEYFFTRPFASLTRMR